MAIILEDIQCSDGWVKSRLGCPSASKFDEIVTTTGEPSKSQEKYLSQLATEQITGVYAGSDYSSSSMKRGSRYEPEARALFSLVQDVDIKEVGFCFPNEERCYGASPDGLFLDTGLEIYCPESPNAVFCLLHPDKAIAKAKKYQQIMGTMLVMGFDHYFFLMYYPGLKPLILKVERDELFIKKLEAELSKFCLELVGVVRKLKSIS